MTCKLQKLPTQEKSFVKSGRINNSSLKIYPDHAHVRRLQNNNVVNTTFVTFWRAVDGPEPNVIRIFYSLVNPRSISRALKELPKDKSGELFMFVSSLFFMIGPPSLNASVPNSLPTKCFSPLPPDLSPRPYAWSYPVVTALGGPWYTYTDAWHALCPFDHDLTETCAHCLWLKNFAVPVGMSINSKLRGQTQLAKCVLRAFLPYCLQLFPLNGLCVDSLSFGSGMFSDSFYSSSCIQFSQVPSVRYAPSCLGCSFCLGCMTLAPAPSHFGASADCDNGQIEENVQDVERQIFETGLCPALLTLPVLPDVKKAYLRKALSSTLHIVGGVTHLVVETSDNVERGLGFTSLFMKLHPATHSAIVGRYPASIFFHPPRS